MDPARLLRLHRPRLRARRRARSTASSGSGAAPSASSMPGPRRLIRRRPPRSRASSTRSSASSSRPSAPRAAGRSTRPLAAPCAARAGRPIRRFPRRASAGARRRASGPYEGACATSSTRSSTTGGGRWRAPLAALMREPAATCSRDADAVVPVPLHWRRRRRRGFNQAALLAAGLGLPVCHALRRVAPHARPDRPARRRASAPTSRGAFGSRGATAGRACGRSRPRAAAPRRPGGGAGRRCEHDGRDAGGVRARAEGRRGARECARLRQRESSSRPR